jgi:hypothetical protein
VLGSARKKQEEDTHEDVLPREDHRHHTIADGINPSPLADRTDHAPLPSA